MTPEDRTVWLGALWGAAGGTMVGYEALLLAYRSADRRDAALMLQQSRHLPGFAVIEVRHAEGMTTHVIAGRLAREFHLRFRAANPELFAGIPDRNF